MYFLSFSEAQFSMFSFSTKRKYHSNIELNRSDNSNDTCSKMVYFLQKSPPDVKRWGKYKAINFETFCEQCRYFYEYLGL